MTQYAQPLRQSSYVAAGSDICPFERIVVANTVELPGLESEDESSRVAYKAERARPAARFGVPLPWAVLLIAVTIVIMSALVMSTARQGVAVRAEIERLKDRYASYEKERLSLDERLSAARDSNFICYYASQNLGMKLALHEETVKVTVRSTGTAQESLLAGIGAWSGHR